MSAWDAPGIADLYEAFCVSFSRYGHANEELVSHARLAHGMRVIDLAAGTGRTAEAALRLLGDEGAVVCVEPSEEMRTIGSSRVAGPQVQWRAGLPDSPESFDRILCGAAVWQLTPLPETFRRLCALLRPGGALCFNIPALYLLEPDDPGGGEDPLLLSLPGRMFGEHSAPGSSLDGTPLTSADITNWLHAAGFRPEQWSFRHRLTQEEYAAWLKIPLLTDRMLPGILAADRSRLIDEALNATDRRSWKWERWKGWTAWKQ